jgi:hypothetical protein
MLVPPFEEGALKDRLALALPGETVATIGAPGNVAVVVLSELPPPPPQASKLEEISRQRPYWTTCCGRNGSVTYFL